ncbi:hypothetical protein NPIL_669371 [Nephila pilipes]|uniref:Uncharacterized protein n=1 Tax=Nephila pilipes TaxID=299642 RepID=A0A8X6P829_NEPPI|nr:hypothetical protein NPIL_366121 [Nephila pilipes]GFU62919.1 hypothetical protein NPIL_669371 [Nephila pilipes]
MIPFILLPGRGFLLPQDIHTFSPSWAANRSIRESPLANNQITLSTLSTSLNLPSKFTFHPEDPQPIRMQHLSIPSKLTNYILNQELIPKKENFQIPSKKLNRY